MQKPIYTFEEKTIVRIHLVPGSSVDKVLGVYNHRIKIKIREKPIKGRANSYLIKFLASLLKITVQDIVLIRGDISGQKDFSISIDFFQAIESFGLDKDSLCKYDTLI